MPFNGLIFKAVGHHPYQNLELGRPPIMVRHTKMSGGKSIGVSSIVLAGMLEFTFAVLLIVVKTFVAFLNGNSIGCHYLICVISVDFAIY